MKNLDIAGRAIKGTVAKTASNKTQSEAKSKKKK